MSGRLPGGGKPWFERRRKVRPWGATRWQLNPCSIEGWVMVAGYVAVLAASIFLMLPRPTTGGVTAYVAVVIAASMLLIAIAFRMSAPEWRDE